jgi:uncharacterized protein (DUF1697 family)
VALVALIKGMNVGGHRRFQPSKVAKELAEYDVVSIGAAGTFVSRGHVSPVKLRAELAKRLPSGATVVVFGAVEIERLIARAPFARRKKSPAIVQFVATLAKRVPTRGKRVLDIPSTADWCVRVLGHDGRFVWGEHRREMRAIGHLAEIERVFGATATVRSWNTMESMGKGIRHN